MAEPLNCVIVDDIGPMGDARRLRISIEDGRITVMNLNAPDVALNRPAYGYEKQLFAVALTTRPPASASAPDGHPIPISPLSSAPSVEAQGSAGWSSESVARSIEGIKLARGAPKDHHEESFQRGLRYAARLVRIISEDDPPVEAQGSERMLDTLQQIAGIHVESYKDGELRTLADNMVRIAKAALKDSSPTTKEKV